MSLVCSRRSRQPECECPVVSRLVANGALALGLLRARRQQRIRYKSRESRYPCHSQSTRRNYAARRTPSSLARKPLMRFQLAKFRLTKTSSITSTVSASMTSSVPIGFSEYQYLGTYFTDKRKSSCSVGWQTSHTCGVVLVWSCSRERGSRSATREEKPVIVPPTRVQSFASLLPADSGPATVPDSSASHCSTRHRRRPRHSRT